MIPYIMARHIITSAVVDTENDDALVNIKGYQKREWLKDMLENERCHNHRDIGC